MFDLFPSKHNKSANKCICAVLALKKSKNVLRETSRDGLTGRHRAIGATSSLLCAERSEQSSMICAVEEGDENARGRRQKVMVNS